MKIEYEKIVPDQGSSFKVLHWRSHQDRFFWHQHPEHEIVYIHKGSGKRHIGAHLSYFEEGELMFIGPNVPHLNFGYGADDAHEEIVVQLRDDFMGTEFLQKPEMQAVKQLFERSKQGIKFFGETRKQVANMMLNLPQLSEFERLVELLMVFRKLALTPDFELLNTIDARFEYSHRDEERIGRIYAYVEAHYQQDINLQHVADLANLTVPSFCRFFKKMMQMTFTDFVNEYRINQACKLLTQNQTVAESCYASGFNNESHFTKTFKHITGKNPRDYRAEVRRF
ncbi:MAG: AraC family transcriptional regulator [Runella slithyformis]|nr:MAG: AraC family transcriptional regulator [Runella slithyformis]TAF96652.1 MAG: AraC family transcriptional regulator [Runella sp.]TAG20976.1 MAG: AraC family transcriptional regulator [Cytophagales bacterium]TAG40142.1 MAG: AraC family transcriptional regulator [Cytophagia bacterium]TAF02512.1 MAG: AraC family transcriptional regulator [Runella slithyformis]